MMLPLGKIQDPQPASQSSAQIEIRGASKRYANGNLALEAIDLSIAESEFVSMIGPSGCGKSTLLKLVAGLTRLSSGSIRVAGVEPVKARKIMSFMFQDHTLLPWRTVQRNVELSAELRGVKKKVRAEKAREMLGLVGLTQAANQFPRQLSGGMKMRVSIARALSTRPQILLMDEPFAALDEMNRDRLNEELLRLRAQDRWTGLFVTHSVAEAVFLSDRIIVLAAHPGRVAYDIPIEFDLPRNSDLRIRSEYEEKVIEVAEKLRSVTNSVAATVPGSAQ